MKIKTFSAIIISSVLLLNYAENLSAKPNEKALNIKTKARGVINGTLNKINKGIHHTKNKNYENDSNDLPTFSKTSKIADEIKVALNIDILNDYISRLQAIENDWIKFDKVKKNSRNINEYNRIFDDYISILHAELSDIQDKLEMEFSDEELQIDVTKTRPRRKDIVMKVKLLKNSLQQMKDRIDNNIAKLFKDYTNLKSIAQNNTLKLMNTYKAKNIKYRSK